MADTSVFSPSQRRDLQITLEQLSRDGYGESDLRDYANGFKSGYLTSDPLGVVGKAVQGATLGYGDEIKGAIRSVVSGNSRLYETARARGQLARSSRDAPVSSTLAEVAGTVPPALLMGRLGGGPGQTAVGNALRGAAAGAVAGGVYGSGEAQGGLGQRLVGALEGGTVGGLTGAIAAPLTEAGMALGRRIGAALHPAAAQGLASRAFRTAIDESGATPAGVGARMSEAQAAGTPLTMAEAVGPQGVDLLETAAQAPGPGRQAIMEQVGGRQRYQPRRLVEQLRGASGVTGGSVDTMQAEAATRAAASRPAYQALGAVDLPDDLMRPMWTFLQTRAGRSAYRRAADFAEQARVRGDPGGQLPSFDAITRGARLTAGEADTILQGLEATAERRMTPSAVPGRLSDTRESIAYNQTARYLRDQIARRVPEFENARATWAGPTQFIEAVRRGDTVKGLDLDTFNTLWRNSSVPEQHGLTIGFINDLKADLENFRAGPTADASRKLASVFSLREKLTTMLGANQAAPLLRAIDTEAGTSATANQVLGNSSTARRQAAQEMLGEAPGRPGLPSSIGEVVRGIYGHLDQFSRRYTRQALARLGLTTSPADAERLVEQILAQAPNRPPGMIPGALIGGPAGAVAAQIARPRQ